MKRAHCVLYEPPSKQYPVLAVLLTTDGEVLATRAVHSNESADINFAELITEMRATGNCAFVIETRSPGINVLSVF